MRMIKTLALSLVLAATTAPAWAQAEMETERPLRTQIERDTYETQVPPLTYSEEENRMAAALYMQDALQLLDRAEVQLRNNQQRQAVSALLAASGKLTTAYLELHQDREFSQQIQPLTMSAEQAVQLAERDPQQALALVSAMVPEVASLYQVQVAQLGGGAGTGLEGFGELREPEIRQQPIMPEQQQIEPDAPIDHQEHMQR